MAVKRITNISSGIFTREIDLTQVTQAAGTFAGGSIALTQKGPAFEIITSASFEERRLRLGDLNPDFPSSYYARGFLNQANNYKEVRVLGLEGYTDDASLDGDATSKSFVLMLDIPASPPTPATPGTEPVVATSESVIAVLKPRRSTFTALADVDRVSISPAAGEATATDEKFSVTIDFTDASSTTVTASLRPGSKDYIGKIFGTDPRDGTLIEGQPSPLWVEFVIPSVTRRPDPDSVPAGESPLDSNHPEAFYYPGDDSPQTTLNLVEGDVTIDLSFEFPTTAISDASNTDPIVVTATGHGLSTGDQVDITGVGGNTAANGSFFINVLTGDTFELYNDQALTDTVAGNGAYTSGGTVKKSFAPTWEREVMDFADIPFQTPITPWFVSDFDSDGAVKRLFRVWSISDGETANTEIKVEITNIDPTGNGGSGTFDLFVRQFSDSEDLDLTILEGFRNLTMDPTSDNYVLRRIGDGENFQIRSRFIFLELNESEPLPEDAIPYGVEGVPNVSGITMPDVVWTTEYDRTRTIRRQALGAASNNINSFITVAADQLAFKNVTSLASAQGKGFHLNPQELDPNTGLGATVSVTFDLADPSVYTDKNDNPVTANEKVRRSRYVVPFYGGFDGFNEYNERQWDDPTSKDFEALELAIEVFNDPESLEADFSVMVTPDINIVDHSAATEAVLEMVEDREDALYVFDFAFDQEADPQIASDTLKFSEMKSSFGATYFPHVQIEDDVNKVNLFLPPSLIALQTIASVATNEQVWQPPAGSLRTVTTDLIRTRRRMRLDDREILKEVNINPITEFPGSGFEITESRTTQEVFSALSFIHNRLLLGFAKKALNQSLRPLLHQLQTDSLQRAFENTVRPIFNRIQKLNGVERFTVTVLDVEEDRTTLNGQIEIVPLFPVERIIVDFVLTDDGVNFNQQ